MNVVVYSKDMCPYCTKAMHLLDSLEVKYDVKKIGVDVTREELLEVAPNAIPAPVFV